MVKWASVKIREGQVDIPALFSNKSDNQTTNNSNPAPAVVLGDPLAGMPAGSDAAATADDATATAADNQATDAPTAPIMLDGQVLVPNQTIDTNDRSKVGDLKDLEKPKPEPISADLANFLGVPVPPQPEPEPVTAPEPTPPTDATADDAAASVVVPEPPAPEDPEKTAFIKTYTQEFDDALHRATTAAQKILDAIDAAVREHSSDITIPEEANEFLDAAPDDGKVQKFEDARAIVRTVMAKAEAAKQQSEAAAEEAAKVYDEVQEFKRETKEQIAQLVDDEQAGDEANVRNDG